MKANHGVFHRVHAGLWLLLCALHCVPLTAQAANAGNIGRASISGNGRTVIVGAPGSNAGGSTIPISPNVGGWTQAGNYGVPTTATGPTAGINYNGEFIVGGSGKVKYPVTATSTFPWTAVAGAALGVVCGGTVVCAVTAASIAAAPYIKQWIESSGGRVNPQTGGLERQDPDICTAAPCFEWRATGPYTTGYMSTRVGACVAFQELYNAGSAGGQYVVAFESIDSASRCRYTLTVGSGSPQPGGVTANLQSKSAAPASSDWMPASMDDIAPYMGQHNPDPRVWGEVIAGGGEVPLPAPTVTGPASVDGPEVETVKQDGSRTVERTRYNFTTNNNQITNTTNVTTTNTYNSGGTLTGTDVKTETPSVGTPREEELQGQCDKFPQSLGCAELDTPAGTIPKEKKTVTYAEESRFGGGSCPADKMWQVQTIGRSVKAVDWTQLCEYSLPFRGIVLVLAAWAAIFIIMPGGTQRP